MLIVDTQVHTGIYKYEPVEALLFQMERNGVSKAVLIQHRGQTDNGYHLECVRRYPDRLVSVCLVDADREDATARLASWAEQGVQGVRLWPPVRSPGVATRLTQSAPSWVSVGMLPASNLRARASLDAFVLFPPPVVPAPPAGLAQT